jgi:endogenous inhibitor of DNA gyrase (YacG/DUF329 family)
MEVKCPTCGRPAVYNLSNPARPFCSERCKLIDLGAWADERYRVPTTDQQTVNENDQENPSERDDHSKHLLN